MPRFAILAHDQPTPHWDLFLEAGDHLRSFRLLTPLTTASPAAVESMGPHRLMYLDYEGPVSHSRGTVSRVDAGSFDWLQDDEAAIAVRLAGQRFQGKLVFEGGEAFWSE